MISVSQTPKNRSSSVPGLDAARKLISIKMFLTFLITLSSGLLLMLLTLIIPFFKNQPDSLLTQLTQQIGIALFVAGIVSLLTGILVNTTRNELRSQIDEFLQGDVHEEFDTIQNGIKEQTKQFVDTSASLQAMSDMRITRMYLKRKDAVDDIRQDLGNPGISTIQLIGISLNDFVRDSGAFHEVWKVIEGYIRGNGTTPALNKIVDIQVLIIDPACQGAHLRSLGEYRDSPNEAVKSLLAMDSKITQTILSDLTKAAEKNPNVKFSFRFYQSTPLLFLLRTNTATYVQSYHFWRSREPDTSLPLLRYDGNAYIHDGMDAHFDWLWKNASVSYLERVEQYTYGTDKGLHQSGLINVFDDPSDAKKRILALLQSETEHLYLLGVSLHSYAVDNDELYCQIEELAEKGDVDIQILLINPNSEQAIYRAFREYRLAYPKHKITFEEFKKGKYKTSKLYQDTEYTIKQFRKIDNSKNKLHVKWYHTAPYCFMLMVDKSVLVEQYHLGNIDRDTGTKILGKDMPRFEYVLEPSDLYDANKPLRAYKLLKEHFRFVYEECAEEVPDSFGVINADDILSANRAL